MAELKQKRMDIDCIFPTPVGIMRDVSLTQQEIDFLKNQELHDNIENKKSIDTYILEKEPMAQLHAVLLDCLKKYFEATYKPHSYVDIKITQSWVNFAYQNESHHHHYHQNSLISGCLYVAANKNEHKISFSKSDHPMMAIEPSEMNQFNSSDWTYPVETGQLILFPSSLHHYVPKNDSESDRISLAFNSYPIGILGREHGATELKLYW